MVGTRSRGAKTEFKQEPVEQDKKEIKGKRERRKRNEDDARGEEEKPAVKLMKILKREKVGEEVKDIEDIVKDEGEKKVKWEAVKWREMLEGVREMRKNRDAPVDTMGCHMCADSAADEKNQRFQILISLLMSSQTKDQVNFAACSRLRELGFTAEILKDANEEDIARTICPVGFYKTKAKNIKAIAGICFNEYQSDIPHTIDQLCKLPGIGPKMAYLAMNCAWNETIGIGVDTHVHRLAQRWKWLPKGKTSSPEDTRTQLESWIPSDLWKELNWLLVGFGQTICTPLKPKCGDCLNNKICPNAFKEK